MPIIPISALKNMHEGERVFLIGNGPSLAKTPLQELSNEYTLAMNQIDLIYPDTNWRPDFYLNTHKLSHLHPGLEASVEVHADIDSTHLILNKELHDSVADPVANVTYLKVNHIQDIQGKTPRTIDSSKLREAEKSWLDQYWSNDLRQFVWSFHTMYVAAQLSLWMGFDEVYFLGCDLGKAKPIYMPIKNDIDPISYSGQKLKYFQEGYQQNKLISTVINGIATKLLTYIQDLGVLHMVRRGPDTNHFSPDYGRKSRIFSYAFEEIRLSHTIIKRILENEGVKVQNATIGGNLEVYSRVDLAELL